MSTTDALFSLVSTKFAEYQPKASKLPFMVNTSWEGDARNGEVKIITVSNATLRDYSPAASGSVVDDFVDAGANILKLDQQKYFSAVVDKTQALTPGYIVKYVEKAMTDLSVENDKYVVNTLTPSFTTNVVAGSGSTPVNVNSSYIVDRILEAADLLRVQGQLTENAFVAIPSQWYGMVTKAASKYQFPVSQDSYFAGTQAIKIGGMNVVDCPSYVITNDTVKILFGNPDAIANGNDPGELEFFEKIEKGFGSKYKNLMRFGAKIVLEKAGGYIYAKKVAEL